MVYLIEKRDYYFNSRVTPGFPAFTVNYTAHKENKGSFSYSAIQLRSHYVSGNE